MMDTEQCYNNIFNFRNYLTKLLIDIQNKKHDVEFTAKINNFIKLFQQINNINLNNNEQHIKTNSINDDFINDQFVFNYLYSNKTQSYYEDDFYKKCRKY